VLISQVCYSWWDLAGMSIIGRLEWINRDKLIDFILGAQVGPAGSHLHESRTTISDPFHSSLAQASGSRPIASR
jgi:prenyltransferase beta subunit